MDIVDWLQAEAENPQLARLTLRGSRGEELTETEARQYERRARALFRYWEDVHYQYRQGLYDEIEFSSHREAWGETMRLPGYVDSWCGMRGTFSPEFREELDGFLTESSC